MQPSCRVVVGGNNDEAVVVVIRTFRNEFYVRRLRFHFSDKDFFLLSISHKSRRLTDAVEV